MQSVHKWTKVNLFWHGGILWQIQVNTCGQTRDKIAAHFEDKAWYLQHKTCAGLITLKNRIVILLFRYSVGLAHLHWCRRKAQKQAFSSTVSGCHPLLQKLFLSSVVEWASSRTHCVLGLALSKSKIFQMSNANDYGGRGNIIEVVMMIVNA